jgi:hypothetical protein
MKHFIAFVLLFTVTTTSIAQSINFLKLYQSNIDTILAASGTLARSDNNLFMLSIMPSVRFEGGEVGLVSKNTALTIFDLQGIRLVEKEIVLQDFYFPVIRQQALIFHDQSIFTCINYVTEPTVGNTNVNILSKFDTQGNLLKKYETSLDSAELFGQIFVHEGKILMFSWLSPPDGSNDQLLLRTFDTDLNLLNMQLLNSFEQTAFSNEIQYLGNHKWMIFRRSYNLDAPMDGTKAEVWQYDLATGTVIALSNTSIPISTFRDEKYVYPDTATGVVHGFSIQFQANTQAESCLNTYAAAAPTQVCETPTSQVFRLASGCTGSDSDLFLFGSVANNYIPYTAQPTQAAFERIGTDGTLAWRKILADSLDNWDNIIFVDAISDGQGGAYFSAYVSRVLPAEETMVSAAIIGHIGADGCVDLGCNDTLYVPNATSSTLPVLEELNVSAYPNPASDFLTLKYGSSIILAQAEIMDLHGRLVSSIAQPNSKIELESLNQGFYVLRLTDTNGKQAILRFIKA